MNARRSSLVAALCLAAVVMIAAPQATFAQNAEDLDNSQSSAMLHKLGRGVVNLFTGVVEVPKAMAREWKRTDPVTGTVVGFFKGVGWGWTRTMTGAYEIATFPFPVPPGYEPIMEPEFVLTDTWGEPIPQISEHPDWAVAPRVPRY